MKKIINYFLAAFMAIVLIFGIIATCLTVITLNPKNIRADISKDGRIKSTANVERNTEHLYVKDLDIEIITKLEQLNRYVLHYKIVYEYASKDYEQSKTDANYVAMMDAYHQHATALTMFHTMEMFLFLKAAETFFETYGILILILAISIITNTSIDYDAKYAPLSTPYRKKNYPNANHEWVGGRWN